MKWTWNCVSIGQRKYCSEKRLESIFPVRLFLKDGYSPPFDLDQDNTGRKNAFC